MTPLIFELIFAAERANGAASAVAAANLVKSRRVCITTRSYHCLDYGADRFGDDPAVKAAVPDEVLASVHPRHQHAREIHSLAVAFERIGISVGTPRFRIEPDAVRLQKLDVGMIAGHREHEVVRDSSLPVGCFQSHRI